MSNELPHDDSDDEETRIAPGYKPVFPGMQEVHVGADRHQLADDEELTGREATLLPGSERPAGDSANVSEDTAPASSKKVGTDRISRPRPAVDQAAATTAESAPIEPTASMPVVQTVCSEAALSGREPTLLPESKRDERTVHDAGTTEDPDAAAAVALGVGEAPLSAPSSTDTASSALTGERPATARGAPESASLSGREATLLPGQTPDAQAEALSGREATLLPGGDDGSAAVALSGREATLLPVAGAALSGREQTLVSDDARVEAGAMTPMTGDTTCATVPTFTAGVTGDIVETKKPATKVPSSSGFDAGWHLAGRKGPFTGQNWGDFELGGILGEGGMGAVYRGMQTSLKRRVAIKVLPPNLAQDQNLLHRFRLEAETASKIISPHVVQVYFIGSEDDNHYYAMEYVEGTDLYEIIKNRREAEDGLKPEEAADYILQAAKGLTEAGRFGVVHRDIKPPNMMVDRHNLLKLADFGIVKVLGESQLTMTGQAVGTPAYVSPEQGRGDAEIDQRSDLYSLGVVFYEVACGRKPFQATTPNALIYKHCFEEPELPRAVNPAISDEYQAVIMRLLQKKPENRYQTAAELVVDLEGIKTGAMLASAIANFKGTGADEAKREQLSWVQRHLLAVSTAALLLIGLAVGGGYWYVKEQESANLERIEAEREAERLAKELRPMLEQLDSVAPLPAGVDELLAEYADKLPDGAANEDVHRWRGKLQRVADLRQRLMVLDDEQVDAAERRQATQAIAEYTAEVGNQDPAAVRWQARLDDLQAAEQQVRDQLAALATQAYDAARRDAAAGLVGRLTTLVGKDEALVQQTRARIAAFDEQVAGLLHSLEALDRSDVTITEEKRVAWQAALGQLEPLLGSGDERIQRWRVQLDQAGGLVERLRGNLGSVFNADSLPPLAAIDRVSADLTVYASLAGDEDSDLKRWRAQAAGTEQRVAALRQRLQELQGRVDDDGILPAPVLEPAGAQVDELAGLAGGGDQQVMDWRQRLEQSAGVHAALQRRLQRLDRPEPITQAEAAALHGDLQRLVALGGLAEADTVRLRQRLADEAERVAALRRRLQLLDQAQPFSQQVATDLQRFLTDVPADDVDAQRWATKAAAIGELRQRLGVLDQQAPVPDNLAQQFERLQELVGAEAPEVLRWQEKVAMIVAAWKALAPLVQAVSIPADATAQLTLLEQQVGPNDAQVVTYRQKLQRVEELSQRFVDLEPVYLLDPSGLRGHELLLDEWRELVGRDDAAWRRGAERLAELRGPERPGWASAAGRDAHGPWAELRLGDLVQRFRYLPPCHGSIGSPESEADRDADEVLVEVRLSRGLWLADTELTQAWWTAHTGAQPSRFDDPQRPVERIDRAQVDDFLQNLNEALVAVEVRLPTEAEWELACRAGERGPWPSPIDSLGWSRANSGSQTQPVAQRYPNALGLFDMHGNVAEWVADDYRPYATAAVVDPIGRGGEQGVARGGSWGDARRALRAGNRLPLSPGVRSCYLGTRIAIPAARVAPIVAQRRVPAWQLRLGIAEVTLSLPWLVDGEGE